MPGCCRRNDATPNKPIRNSSSSDRPRNRVAAAAACGLARPAMRVLRNGKVAVRFARCGADLPGRGGPTICSDATRRSCRGKERDIMTYVVTEACIRCKYMDCVEVCPVDCFYE